MDILVDSLRKVYYLRFHKSIQVYEFCPCAQLLNSPSEGTPFKIQNCMLEFHEKKGFKKKYSVKRLEEGIEHNRLLVPNEMSLLQNVNHDLLYDAPHFSSQPFLQLFMMCSPTESPLQLRTCTEVRGTAHEVYFTDYLVQDAHNRLFTKRVMELEQLDKMFGVKASELLECFQVCMPMSTYLPRIYLAGVQGRNLEVYSTYFE